MGNNALLADEAPLTLQSLPLWVLFSVIVVAVTFVASVFIAATSLLPRRGAPLVAGAIGDRDQVGERTRPEAAEHLLVLPPTRP